MGNESTKEPEPPTCILESKLYLGGYDFIGTAIENFKQYKVTDVINVAGEDCRYSELRKKRYDDEKIFVREYSLFDRAYFNIVSHGEHIAELINMLITSGSVVYIHCAMGINRSVAVVVLYLIKFQKMKPADAIKFVRDRRPGVLTNVDFEEKLLKVDVEVETQVEVKNLNETVIENQLHQANQLQKEIKSLF